MPDRLANRIRSTEVVSPVRQALHWAKPMAVRMTGNSRFARLPLPDIRDAGHSRSTGILTGPCRSNPLPNLVVKPDPPLPDWDKGTRDRQIICAFRGKGGFFSVGRGFRRFGLSFRSVGGTFLFAFGTFLFEQGTFLFAFGTFLFEQGRFRNGSGRCVRARDFLQGEDGNWAADESAFAQSATCSLNSP